MKRWIGAALVVLLTFLGAACDRRASTDPAGDARPHAETPVAFSFDPPAGWVFRPFPGLKHQVAVGPAASGFAPNINVVEEPFGGTLDAYVNGNLASMQRLFKEFHLLQRDDFRTAEGLEGARLIAENTQNGKRLRQTFYLFGKGDRKFVVTCSALAEGGDELDPVFEASMKTFRFDGK
jgi:hypothetical protein